MSANVTTENGTLWAYAVSDKPTTVGLAIEIRGARVDINVSLEEAERYVKTIDNAVAYKRWCDKQQRDRS